MEHYFEEDYGYFCDPCDNDTPEKEYNKTIKIKKNVNVVYSEHINKNVSDDHEPKQMVLYATFCAFVVCFVFCYF